MALSVPAASRNRLWGLIALAALLLLIWVPPASSSANVRDQSWAGVSIVHSRSMSAGVHFNADSVAHSEPSGSALVRPVGLELASGATPLAGFSGDVTKRPIAVSSNLGVAAKAGRNFDNYGGEFLDDAIRSPVVRPDVAGMSSKIQRQMGTRGWTPGLIDEAVLQGRAFPAVNKLGGANTPATRYVHPRNGQSVVIDNATGEIIQVGGAGFRY